jgi:hypothetical protein
MHQLLESEHTFTLGELFKITPNLRQYVTAKIAPRRKIVIMPGPNPVIAFVAIDPHMVVIKIQVGKNMVEDILLGGGSNTNIMTKELQKWLRPPSPKLAPYIF